MGLMGEGTGRQGKSRGGGNIQTTPHANYLDTEERGEELVLTSVSLNSVLELLNGHW